jgi:hypothetical protein
MEALYQEKGKKGSGHPGAGLGGVGRIRSFGQELKANGLVRYFPALCTQFLAESGEICTQDRSRNPHEIMQITGNAR